MSIYTMGDLHLSFGASKPMDIFGSHWANHFVKIEENWQALVQPDDTVVINGDVSWGMSLEDALWDFDYIHRLNGKKIISKGNHDYWWSTANKMNQFLQEQGFSSISILHNNAFVVEDVVVCGTRGWFIDEGDATGHNHKIFNREVQRLRTSLQVGRGLGAQRELVVFLHYPPVYPGFCCQELVDTMKEYGVRRCYYGHLHGSSHRKAILGEYDGVCYHLTSCDFNDFRPLPVER